MQIIRKITTKAVAGKIDFDKLLAAPGKHIDLMKVYGVARKALPQQTDLGAFIKFTGSFRAESCVTGDMFQSGSVILPGVAQDLLAGALDGDAVDDVQFGFIISVAYNADSVTKYSYEVVSLLTPSEDDPLERLGASLGITKKLEAKFEAKLEAKLEAEFEAEMEAEMEAVAKAKQSEVKHVRPRTK